MIALHSRWKLTENGHRHVPCQRLPGVVQWIGLSLAILFTNMAANTDADWQGPLQSAVSLPERGAKPAGFIVDLAFDDLRLFGELPIHVHIASSGGSFPADRSIVIRVVPTAKTSQPPGLDCVYELPIQLSQGQSTIEKTFYVPKWSVGGELDVAVLEDRRVIEGYQSRIPGNAFGAGQAETAWWESAEQGFAWMVDDNTSKPDARTFFAAMAPELMNVEQLSTARPGFDFASAWRQFRVSKIDQLPTDWRGFDSADVWIAESDTLRSLFKQPSARTSALRDYLRCGGCLWVIGELDEQELSQFFQVPRPNIDELNVVLDGAVLAARSAVDYQLYRATNYQAINSSRGYIREYAMNLQSLSQRNRGAIANSLLTVEERFDVNLEWLQSQAADGNAAVLNREDFDVRRVALGRIVICKSASPLPGSIQQWCAMALLTGDDFSSTMQRAVDPSFGDRRFWDWIIPDVAQPPVYTFIALLSLFVIVVGPLAYRKFTKLGRGYLIMFVAPVLALITTLTMFVYGLLADGLSTRVRVREITWVGDTSGTAARYSRATYFAGVRPADGMSFPGDAVLLPYQLSSASSWFEASKLEHSIIGTMRLTDDSIRLDSGFLPSRQQKQFVTYRPVRDVGVVSLEHTQANKSPLLTSSLNIEIRNGVLCNSAGEYFSFDRLPANSTTTAQPVTPNAASELLSGLYALQRPIAPSAISSVRRSGDAKIDMISQLESHPTRRVGAMSKIANGESAIESWVRLSLQIESRLPRATLIAVADVTDDCIAVDEATVVESVHYVIGKLP